MSKAGNKPTDIKKLIAKIMNIIVLLCSIAIFMILSIEILEGYISYPPKIFSTIQLIICLIFLIDFFYLLFLSENKKRYIFTHFLFFLVSIPYLNIIEWMHIDVSSFFRIILRSILLIRAGYGLVIMIAWFTKSKITNLLYSYLIILLGMSYFGSLAFYMIEKDLNPGIKNFGDSLWWACMDVTTVGCAIEPTTSEGRILAVILAVLGMSMFPILTAYITNMFQYGFNNPNGPSSGNQNTSSGETQGSTNSAKD